MTLKKYLFFMITATIMCVLGWLEVLFFVNPYEAGTAGFALFYLSLFCGLLGMFSILGFLVRYIFKKGQFAYVQVKTSFRQGFMFALLLVVSLFLQGQKLLVWWNLVLLVLLLAVVEYLFVSGQSKGPVNTVKTVNTEN